MNLPFLAQRIREIRKKRMLTLEQLADRTQLTQSVLSKVENCRVTPSLAALSRIAEALGVTLSELVAGMDDERPMIVVRGDENFPCTGGPKGKLECRSLAPTRHQKRFEPVLLEVLSGAKGGTLPPRNGEFFLYVVDGAVRVKSGDENCELAAGDAVYLTTSENPRVLSANGAPAKCLCVWSGDESRLSP